MADASFRNLRDWYQVPTKRGTLPRLYGLAQGTDIYVGLRLDPDRGIDLLAEHSNNQQRLDNFVNNQTETLMMFPRGFNPPHRLMSRFLAKVGLERSLIDFHMTQHFFKC